MSEPEAPKVYTHGEITIDHNSDRVRLEGPGIKIDIAAPVSMHDLQALIYQVIDVVKDVTYITLTEENEDTRKTIEEW